MPRLHTAPSERTLRRTLRQVFRLDGWRPGQLQVIRRVLEGRPTLALMPTAAGKSLCYQLPALHLRKPAVVVSPLIALMHDQAEKLRALGVAAQELNSTLTMAEQQAALDAFESGSVRVLFVTPERLADEAFLGVLRRGGVGLLAVDEAHCISRWGHDFRPAYLEIGAAWKALGAPPLLALTATATEEVVADLRRHLSRDLEIVEGPLYRPNLRLRVIPCSGEEEKLEGLHGILMAAGGRSIVYCATVRAAESLHQALKHRPYAPALYHGRLPPRDRSAAQRRFIDGKVECMIATNAFGMGIDRPDIRCIVHWQIPGSLDAYYQEAGRAGRDGAESQCVLLYDPKDKQVQQLFLAGSAPTAQELQSVWAALVPGGSNGTAGKAMGAQVRGLAPGRLRQAIATLKALGLVRSDRRQQHRIARDARPPDFESLAREIAAAPGRDRRGLEGMVGYAQSALCRWRLILGHFEGPRARAEGWNCGHCDNCLGGTAELAQATPRVGIDAGRLSRAEPPEAPFAEGQVVVVARYGRAKVLKVEDDRVTVSCRDGIERVFLARYVRRAARGKPRGARTP